MLKSSHPAQGLAIMGNSLHPVLWSEGSTKLVYTDCGPKLDRLFPVGSGEWKWPWPRLSNTGVGWGLGRGRGRSRSRQEPPQACGCLG